MSWGSESPSGPLASALTPACTCGEFGGSCPCNSCVTAQRVPKEDATSLIKERTAMILGMNPHELRQPRDWNLFLWPKRRHWVLVAQPAGAAFSARIVDDFVHNAQHCFNTEVVSSRFFLVYELLVDHGGDQGGLFLMLSVKPDFDPNTQGVIALGRVGPMVIEDMQEHALGVVRRYRSYSYIGCNCQHFASDLALSLGTPRRKLPEDEATAVAHAASDGAAAFSAAGVAIAATAAVGAGAASAVGAATPCAAGMMLGAVPIVLSTVAVTATAVGLGGGLALIGIAGGYKILYDRLREADECEHACCDGRHHADKAVGTLAASQSAFDPPLPVAREDEVEQLEDTDPAASPCEALDLCNDADALKAWDGGFAEEDAAAGSPRVVDVSMPKAFEVEVEPQEDAEPAPSPQEAGGRCGGDDCTKEASGEGEQRPRAHSADVAAGSS